METMDSIIFNQECASFESTYHIAISENAKKLLYLTLSSIEDDPHPVWDTELTPPKRVTENFLKNLSKYLTDILHFQMLSDNITYFDVLHWLGIRLDSLCPFMKIR